MGTEEHVRNGEQDDDAHIPKGALLKDRDSSVAYCEYECLQA